MESFISIENASLRFRRWRNPSPALKEAVVAKLGRKSSANAVETFESLKNINLNIKGGDRLGIIGLNGAGKSTLLKMVVGIYTPTQGCVRVNGKITPLIELGTGFDHELSGRENIYLNGSMLGRSFRQMQAYEKEIIEFSELEEFIDQPIKYYSSGMHGRLAFSIATTLEPEILLIDEVFSTGDAHFVGKAQARMHNLLNTSHIVVIVTHNMQHIREFCNRVIYLHRGEVMYDGSPDQAIDYYLEAIGQPPEKPSVAKKVKQQSVEDAVDHTERVQLHEVIRVLKEENAALRNKAKILQLESTQHSKDNDACQMRENNRIFETVMKNLVEVRQPVVLISQVIRSGGVLLSNLLDGHSQIHAHPHRLNIGNPDKTSKTSWPALDLNSASEEWFEILRESPSSEAFWTGRRWRSSSHQVSEKIHFLQVPSLQKKIFEACIARQPPKSSRDILDCYMTSYFNSWMDNRSKYVGDKSWITCYGPRMYMQEESLASFFRDYSDGRLISVVRDPRGWLVSLQKHAPNYREDINSALTLWSESSQLALLAKQKYGDRVCIISFEDLVGKTRETMHKLCDFLGIRFEESLLQPTLNSSPVCADSDFFQSQFVLSDEPLTRHRTQLTSEITKSIDEQLHDLHEQVLRVRS
jgi:lipopolysaccharide transport system ATP-binding protein